MGLMPHVPPVFFSCFSLLYVPWHMADASMCPEVRIIFEVPLVFFCFKQIDTSRFWLINWFFCNFHLLEQKHHLKYWKWRLLCVKTNTTSAKLKRNNTSLNYHNGHSKNNLELCLYVYTGWQRRFYLEVKFL